MLILPYYDVKMDQGKVYSRREIAVNDNVSYTFYRFLERFKEHGEAASTIKNVCQSRLYY